MKQKIREFIVRFDNASFQIIFFLQVKIYFM